ncbi:MAG: LysR family transcriptional regulator ArgP [Inhella sp.]
MQLDYAQLAALVAVVREGSFDAAARALHLTPSALSQRIKALEHRLGGPLLLRARPCRITPLGEPLLRHAQQVELLEQGLLQGLLPGTRGETPSLAVAVNADSLSTWFMPAAAAFTQASGALLDLRVDDEGHTAEALQRGEVLAAVTTRLSPLQGCRSVSLGRLRYRACASPAFVARHFPQGLNARSLAVAPALRFNAKDELQFRWLRRLLRRELRPPAHAIPSSQGFVQACEAGLGWALQPEPLVQEALAAGRLLDLAPQLPQDVPLVWQCSRLELPLLQQLTAAVRQAAGVLRR